jgi:AraC-like DNA-binding protein
METVVPEGYAEHAPPLDLARYVLCFWTSLRPSAVETPASPRRVLPDGCVDIVLGFGRDDDPASVGLTEAFGVGAMTKPLIVDGPGPRLYVGVRFRPGFAYAAFGIPAAELTDERVEFDLLGEGPRELADIEMQATDAGRVSATMELVRRRLLGSRIVPAVPRSVRAAVYRIVNARGNLRVASVASEIGVTRQQLAKQFATHVGVTPKMLARINRTQAALARADAARAAHPRQIDWSAIAFDLGYYDQPHFIDDFKALTGKTPGEWIRGSRL